MKKTSKGVVLSVSAAVVAGLLIGGGLWASNMAWKYNQTMRTAPEAFTNINPISLPYNRKSGLDMASDLISDVAAVAGVAPLCALRYNQADGLTQYCPPSPPDFPLNSDEGYFLQMPSSPPTSQYIFSGSEAPCWGLSLQPPPMLCGGALASVTNQCYVALPPNLKCRRASYLLAHINDMWSGCANRACYFNTAGGYSCYTPPSPPDFPLLNCMAIPQPGDMPPGPLNAVLLQFNGAGCPIAPGALNPATMGNPIACVLATGAGAGFAGGC